MNVSSTPSVSCVINILYITRCLQEECVIKIIYRCSSQCQKECMLHKTALSWQPAESLKKAKCCRPLPLKLPLAMGFCLVFGSKGLSLVSGGILLLDTLWITHTRQQPLQPLHDCKAQATPLDLVQLTHLLCIKHGFL